MSTEASVAEKPKRVHPNRVPFAGILARIDEPSTKTPKGSKDHIIVLSRKAAEDALWSLEGMAVSFAVQWDTHNARQKCGVITKAWVDGQDLRVGGYLFCKDFPEIEAQIRNSPGKMGMSYEVVEAHVENMRASIWILSSVIFTGAAILLCDKAAYKSTSFTIEASADEFDGRISFVDSYDATGTLALEP